MQIVIDIPQKWFDDMVREEFTDIDELCAVIQHGTPLPKGHGRLIDADAYKGEMLSSREFDFFKRLDMQPTIIEADKAERDDKEYDDI